ncbi:hypothetical protein GCM10010413_37650 [Promicromonospora sukumoe]
MPPEDMPKDQITKYTAGDEPDLDALVAPPVSVEMVEFSEEVNDRFADHPDFGGVEFSRDRTEITVWWHGAPTAALTSIVAEAPVQAEVSSMEFSAAELTQAAQKLVEADLGAIDVVAAGPSPSGDRIDAVVAGADAQALGTIQEVLQESVEGIPVSFETGEATNLDLNRQYDTYGLGGARIRHLDGVFLTNYCSTGFAVYNPANPSQTGLMFANHCGPLGNDWTVYGGTDLPTYLIGSEVAEAPSDDGAIITHPGSQPYVYTGPWNSGSVAPIDSQATPAIGTEICYGGSYSGTTCGSFVTARPWTWQDPDGGGTIRGFQTERSGTIAAVGQGDSGGPGYIIASSGGTTLRYAAAIVSAGPISSEATCNGIDEGRFCGTTAWVTEPARIELATGWELQTF